MSVLFLAGGGPPESIGSTWPAWLRPGRVEPATGGCEVDPAQQEESAQLADPAQQVRAPSDAGSAIAIHVASVFGQQWQQSRPEWTQASWWEAPLRDDVRGLLWLPPGPRLAAALAHLPAAFPCPLPHTKDRMGSLPVPGHHEGWPCACQVVIAAAWEACAGWAAAGASQALVAAAGPRRVQHRVASTGQVIEEPAREELAAALRWSPVAMGNRIGAARALTAHPPLVELVATGAISPWAGRLVSEHVVDLEDGPAAEVVEEVVARVRGRLASGRRPWHSGEINRQARAARLRVAPEEEQAARVRGFARRRVVVHPGQDGMSTLVAELRDVDARRLHQRLTGLAQQLEEAAGADGGQESRTRDQLRADVLVDVVLAAGLVPTGDAGSGVAARAGLGAGPEASAAQGASAAPGGAPTHDAANGTGRTPRPEISVIIPLQVLLGLAQDPAEVPGVGPIPADLACELAAEGTWRAWVTDAAGAIVATGSRSYVPSESVARLVRAREPHCRFPGCRQPASRCDLDHAIPWPRGSTTPQNLGPLCRRHHNLKTHGGWELIPQGGDPYAEHDPPPDSAVAEVPASPASPESPTAAHGWTWHTPAGLRVADGPAPPF